MVNGNYLISIIIPVYNAEKFLENCIESILSQTYPFWELILVDDGSTDRSWDICKKYSTGDKRIKSFQKVNGGVSSARNLGLKYVCGDYLTFADSDDYLDAATFLTYINEIHLTNPDIIKVGYIKNYVGEKTETVSIASDVRMDNVPDFYRCLERSRYYGFLWNMCIRKECVHGVLFDEDINWCEDHIFSYQCYVYCRKMSVLSYPCYHYQIRRQISLSDVKNPYVLKKASEKGRCLKIKLNNGKYKDIDVAIEEEYLYRLHTIVRLLYQYNYSYKEKKYFYKNCFIPIFPLKYKDEKIFFSINIPFILKNIILRMYYLIKKYKNGYICCRTSL